MAFNFTTIIRILGFVFAFYGGTAHLRAQDTLYSQNFNAGIPANFSLYNIDAQPTASNAAFVTNAWVAVSSKLRQTDSCAFSTSFYASGGTANDWMVLPAQQIPTNTFLNWSAWSPDVLRPEAYEVRIATTNTASALSAGALLYRNFNENTNGWTEREVSLADYAGQTVYIAFRNISTNGFGIAIDDIHLIKLLRNDIAITANSPVHREFTQVPLFEGSSTDSLVLSATIQNKGYHTQTNIRLKADIFQANNPTPIHTITSSTVATLAYGSAYTFKLPNYTPNLAIDRYQIVFTALSDSIDADPTNNTKTQKFAYTTGYYARDNGSNPTINTYGFGYTNPNKMIGTYFPLKRHSVVDSIYFELNNPVIGDTLRAAVYTWNGTAPDSLLAISELYTVTTTSSSLRFGFATPINVDAEGLWVGIKEGRNYTGLGASEAIFTNNTQFIYKNGEGWTPLELWDNTPNVPVVRPKIQPCYLRLTGTVIQPATCNTLGIATVAVADAQGILAYNWSATLPIYTATANLPQGVYTVTVSQNNGCKKTTIIDISAADAPTIAATITMPICKGDSTGTILLSATGNTPTFTYTFQGNPTTPFIDSLPTGTYQVMVADAFGCTASQTVVVPEPSQPLTTGVVDINATICNNQPNGEAITLTQGGVSPYTFLWDNQNTNANPTNLPPGYHSYTVTDANGCKISNTTFVPTPTELIVEIITSAAHAHTQGYAAAHASGGVPDYTYLWSNNSTTNTITDLNPGIYSVTVTDNYGCSKIKSALIEDSTGTTPVAPDIKFFQLNPNPTQGQFSIDIALDKEQDVVIEVFSMLGQRILPKIEKTIFQEKIPFDLRGIPDGVYVVRLRRGYNSTALKVFIQSP